MTRPIISIEDLSKAYRLGTKDKTPDTLVGALASVAKAPFVNWRRLARLDTRNSVNRDDEDIVWALKDVSFDVQCGEVIGIIGRNGAGKSTLLKILSRITEPTSGQAKLRGRVSSLLEVGTGFHPELSGRDNIYMNGTILGMTKREIDRKFDEIVDFSGVEKFLDTPVKRHSSGMQVRLAFAVAAHLEPEILIVDEVLAVGDADFQKKCLGKMQDVSRSGRTVLFVSHNMAAVQNLCSKAILLEQGAVVAFDSCSEVTHQYLRSTVAAASRDVSSCRLTGMQPVIEKVELQSADGTPVSTISCGSTATIVITYKSSEPLPAARFGIRIENLLGENLLFLQSLLEHGVHIDLPAAGVIRCCIPELPLLPGTYFATVGCSSNETQLDVLDRVLEINIVGSDYYGSGRLPSADNAKIVLRSRWVFDSPADELKQ
jgi:lipopolysaccharide transport system ATP-binding protein